MPDLASPAIALLAVAVAWAQWYTARSKLVLDLFNQRIDVYHGVQKVMARVMQRGAADILDISDFRVPQDQARFLFGDEVNKYLHVQRETLVNLEYCRSIMQTNQGDDKYQRAVDLHYKCMLQVTNFFDEFGALMKPYMFMDQKAPMSPINWLVRKTIWPKRQSAQPLPPT